MTIHKLSGFALVEALVSVLVLSVGFLGLANLQARLWSTSSLLHNTSQAYLVATNQLEKARTTWVSTKSIASQSNNTVFTHNLTFNSFGKLDLHKVSVLWKEQSGKQAIELDTYSVTVDTLDTRWLMSPPW